MKNLKDIIKEYIMESNKDLNVLKLSSIDPLIDTIVSRAEKWDKNKLNISRSPMFLISNEDRMVWKQYKYIDMEEDDYGFFKDYAIGKEARPCILGVFIDRCFLPIIDEVSFEGIKKYLK